MKPATTICDVTHIGVKGLWRQLISRSKGIQKCLSNKEVTLDRKFQQEWKIERKNDQKTQKSHVWTNVRPIRFLGSISPTGLLAAFPCTDPKSAKRQSCHQCLFVLLGSLRITAARKMLVKLTPLLFVQLSIKRNTKPQIFDGFQYQYSLTMKKISNKIKFRSCLIRGKN